jgi:hypothetical protein
MEISGDEGQTDDELIKKKGTKDDGDDEESGKDNGTEGADQINSSCNLNVDGGKDQSEKEAATTGSVRRILVLKLKKAKETLMELLKAVMEIMLLEKIMKNPKPMKIMMVVKNNQGKLVEVRSRDGKKLS